MVSKKSITNKKITKPTNIHFAIITLEEIMEDARGVFSSIFCHVSRNFFTSVFGLSIADLLNMMGISAIDKYYRRDYNSTKDGVCMNCGLSAYRQK